MTKILNVCIVYDLKNSDKEKYAYSGYGTTFDSKGSWSFDSYFARNALIFSVDDSSLSDSGNCRNNYLILGEGPNYGRFGAPGK